MFYFSTLENARVHDKNDELIGRLSDIVIKSTSKNHPPVVGIVVKDAGAKRDWFVPAAHIGSWSTDAIILNFCKAEAIGDLPEEPGLLLLDKNIVDKQIVDLEGVKVVRVNDLQFGQIKGVMSLLAIDVSTSGLLRRLGFRRPILHLFHPHLLEWKDVHLIGDRLQLAIGKEELIRLHPADIANIIEKLNLKHGSQLLKSLDETTAAKVLEEVQPEIQKLLVQHLGAGRSADIMSKMSTDELVDLIQLLPAREARKLIDGLPLNKEVSRVKKILEYDEDTAGGLMSTEYITATPDLTIAEVVDKIKKVSHLHRSIYFVYVVDKDYRFLGVVSLRRLLIAEAEHKVNQLIKRIEKIPSVQPEMEMTELAEIMTKYNLLSVAVVDEDDKMMGVVTVDDIMRCFVPHA